MGKLKYLVSVIYPCIQRATVNWLYVSSFRWAGTSTRLRKTVYGERTGSVRWAVCAPVSILTGTSAIDGVAWEPAKILVGKFTLAQARSLNRRPTPFDISSKLAPPILKWDHYWFIINRLFNSGGSIAHSCYVSRHIWRSIVTANTSCTLGATTNGCRPITRISTPLASKCLRQWGRRTGQEAFTRLETAPRHCTRLPVAPTTGRRPSSRWNIRTRSS